MTKVGAPGYRLKVLDDGLNSESRRVRVGGLDINCLAWGSTSDPIAVLVHGNGGHAHWWNPLVPALVPGWRLVAPDLRGHGASDWSEPPSYRLEDFAADLLGVFDAVTSAPVVLVGHSMGGRVAAWFAVHYPERVRKLVLIDTRMSGINARMAQKWRGRIAGTRHGRGYATRDDALAAFRLVPDEPDVAPEVLAYLAEYAVHERGPGDWTFRFDRAVLSLDGDGGGALYSMLGQICCPTLVMHGAASWVMDAAEAASLSAAIPNCRTRVFPGGHHFFLGQGHAVGAALREFIDGAES